MTLASWEDEYEYYYHENLEHRDYVEAIDFLSDLCSNVYPGTSYLKLSLKSIVENTVCRSISVAAI